MMENTNVNQQGKNDEFCLLDFANCSKARNTAAKNLRSVLSAKAERRQMPDDWRSPNHPGQLCPDSRACAARDRRTANGGRHVPLSAQRFLSPTQVARQLGCRDSKVTSWIKSGALRAVNLAADPNGKRPRLRISPDALSDFLLSREVVPSVQPVRRRKMQATGREWF
jgi:hypothetical protein